MKSLRAYRQSIGSLMLALMLSWQIGQPLQAATFYWDNDTNAANNKSSNGVGLGGAGTWDTTSLKWWNLTSDTAWSNAGNDTAVFWGTAGTVALGSGITVGGLTFNTTSYLIGAAGNTNTLTFGANSNIVLNNIAAATINGSLAGSGNVTLTGGVFGGQVAGTLTLSGTAASQTGYGGSTTINNGMTMALSNNSVGLFSTSGITLNGGGITLTNATGANTNNANRVNDTAAITSNGGTITFTNTTAASTTFAETLGALALNSGQTNIVLTNKQTNSSNTQTLTFGTTGTGNLTQTGTAAVTFSSGTSGLDTTANVVKVFGATTTTAGQIIGPWATTGTTAALQTDYAVYSSGFVLPANITASADTTWTDSTKAYTSSTGGALTLGATAHNMTGLRNTGATTVMTIQSGGNLNTYGLLNGVTTLWTIAATGTGALSTPTGGGNLYVNTGSGAVTISAPINDNGGAVTLVKTGSASTLTLSSTSSNFSGGLVIDAGTVTIAANTNLGATTGGITFNGNGGITTTAGVAFGSRTVTLNNGALATITIGNQTGNSFAGQITGTGGLIFGAGGSTGTTLTLSNTANDFQGMLRIGTTGTSAIVAIASLADSSSANGAIRLGGTTGTGTFQWSTAAISALSLDNRQFDLAGTTGGGTIDNANTTAANAITINTDLLVSGSGAKTLTLQGANTGNNTFAGKISDGAGGAVSLTKAGAGTWILAGNNTYTGVTTVSAGTLNISGTGGNGLVTVNGGTLNLTGNGGTGAVTVNNSGTYKISGASGVNNAPITVNAGGTLTVDNTAGAGGIRANRLNFQDLTLAGGTFNYLSGTGASTDNIGTLAIGPAGPTMLNLTANATGATTVTVASLTRGAGGTMLVTGANLGAASGANNANLIVTANGAGADVVGGTGLAGSTTISINAFILGQDTALTGTAQYGFMTDRINGVMLTDGLRNLTAGEYAGTITNGASVLDNVSLRTAVAGLNSLTTINALRLDAGGSMVAGSGTLLVNSGAILSVSGIGTSITVGTLNFGAREAILTPMGSDLSISSIITGSGGLTKTGNGTLTLGGNNGYTGATTVNRGVLRLGSSTALGSSGNSAVTLANTLGVILDLNGSNTSIGSLDGGGTVGGIVSLRGATLTVGSDSTDTSFAGLIYGSGALIKVGSGILTLGAANTFAGPTTISSGTLQGGIAAFLPAATALTVNGTLDLNAFAVTIGQFGGSGIVTNTGGAAALTLGNFAGSFDTTYSGVFNATTPANLTLTKSGGGTLTLTAAAAGTATGTWSLNAGTIKVDYSANGATGNIMNQAAVTLQGGSLNVTGRSGATVTQTLGALSVNTRGGSITMAPNGGASTTLVLGALALGSTPAGAALLVTAPTGTTVTFGTAADVPTGLLLGGRVVFSDGAGNFNWATNSGVNTTTTGFGSYTNLVASGSSSTVNYLQTDTLVGGITASESVNTLKITDTTTGGTLALGDKVLTITTGGLLYTGANGYTISSTTGSLKSNVATASDLIIHQYGTGALTISAIIADGIGASILTKAGTGRLILSGVNTYTGATFVNGGILSISNNNQLGATATSAITISDGATLQSTATLSTGTHTYALPGGNATLDVGAGTTLTVGGVISGVGGLTLNGNTTGTLTITAAATYTGPTFVNSGTLKGGVATFINATTGGNLNVASGALVDMSGFALTVGGIAGSGNIVNSGAAAILSVGGNNQSSTYSGVLQASGTAASLALTKTGTGVLTLNAANLYTGATLLASGGIQFGVNNALAATAVTLGNATGPVAAVLDLNGYNWTSGAITFYGTSSTSTSQAILALGSGTLTLGGNVTATVSGTAANGFQGAFITGGTLDLGTAARTFAIADSINAPVDLTITSAITSAGGLFGITKTGAGTLLLTGANTYTGATVVNGAGGVLALGGAGTLGVAANTLTMTAGILDLNGTNQTVGAFSGAAAGTIRNSAGTSSTLTIGNGTLSTSSLSYAGTFINGGGTLALIKNGQGSLTLTGANTYTGGTQVNDGILVFGNTSAQSAIGITQVASIATLGLGVGGAGFYSAADVSSLFANTLANVNLASGTSIGIDTTAGDFNQTTSLGASSHALVKLGANVLTLSGTNAYTGGTLVMTGTLAISSDANLGDTAGGLTLGTGTTLRVTGTNNPVTNRALTLQGTSTFEVTDAANIFTLGGDFTLGGAFAKTGPGTLKLAGTVTGGANAINVNGGVLQINGNVTTTGTSALGNTAGTQGLLRVVTGGIFSTANLNIGNNATGVGALVVSGGTAAVTNGGTGVGMFLGNGGYGGLFVSSGTLNTGRIETSTSAAITALAVIQQTGGTLNNSEWFLMRNNRFNVVITGGTLDRTGASQNLALVYQGPATAFGDVTIAGGLVNNALRNVTFGQVASSAALGTGVLNLNAGTLRTNQILAYNAAATATTAIVNFNGGTLQASANTTDFIGFSGTGGSTTLTLRSYGAFGSYAGGAVIDTNGFAVTLAQSIQAPTGNGVTSIALTGGGSGYIGAPYVEISGGGGTGATGYATVDLDPTSATYGQVTAITVTNPGVGYSSAPTVTLTGGGGTGATLGAVTTAANTSGGLTKTGAGTLTVSGANTFTGNIVVNGGTLALTGTNATTGSATVNGGTLTVLPTALANITSLNVGATGNATFDLYQDGVGAVYAMAPNANIVLGSATTSGTLGFQLGTLSDSIALSGTGTLTINAGGGLIDVQALAGFGAGDYDIITGLSGITGFDDLAIGFGPAGYALSLINNTTKITLHAVVLAPGDFYWTGMNSSSWKTLSPGTNWSTTADGLTDPGGAPSSLNVVNFSATNASTSPINTTLDAAFSIQGLKILASQNGGTPTGAVTIAAGTGGSLTIGTDGIEVKTGAPAATLISAPVALGAVQTWTVADPGSTLTISGVISGGLPNSLVASAGTSISLTINGSGTVDFSNSANTFTGDILVNGATFILDSLRDWGNATVASTDSHTIILDNGATLKVNASLNPTGQGTAPAYNLIMIGTGGGTIETAAGVTLSLDDAGQLYGSGALTKSGLGTLVLRNQTTLFTGTINITAGVLQVIGGSGGFGVNTAGTTIRSGAALNLNGQTVTDTEPLTIYGTGLAASPAGVITNSSTTGASFAGTVTMGADSTIGSATTGGISLLGGISGAFTLTNSSTGTGTTTIASIGADVVGIVQSGSNGLTITGLYPVATLGTGYNITNSGTGLFTLNGGVGTGTGNLVLNANSTGGITFGTTTVNHVGSITNSGTGTNVVTISAVIGSNVTNVTQNSTSSVLTLSGNNASFAGGVTILKGTVNATTSAGALGTGTVTLGSTSANSSPAQLNMGTNSLTFSNPIVLADRATQTGTLTLGIVVGTVGTTFSGGVTGNNDLVLYQDTNGTSGRIAFTVNPVNISGTVTVNGANTTGQTAVASISGGVGSNVTSLIVNNNFAGLTVQTTALTVNSGGTTLVNNATGGTVLLTVSGGVNGTGDLILRNNSGIANGITLSTSAVNNAGAIINTGTGTGASTISAVIGSSVTGITQNSTTSQLTLSGANTAYTNGVVVKAGTLSVGNANGAGTAASTITLGDAVVNANTVLSGSTTGILAQISLVGANTGTVTITNSAASGFTGGIALNGHDLTVSSTAALLNTLSGGITGIGNLTISPLSTATVTFSTNAINNTGTITNNGASTGLVTISGGVGSNVGNILHSSAGGLTLSTTAIGNTGNLTFSGTGAGVVTVSAAVNTTGAILNNGTTTGTTTISGVIGSSVTSVTQNSTTSQLTLGAVANLWTGGLVIKAGQVNGGNNVNTFGASSNVITLGDSTGNANATVTATNSFTYQQAISVASGNTGVATIIAGTSTGNVIFSGSITLDHHDLTLSKTGTTGASQFTGGITGTGNITINNAATTGTIALATGAVNNIGTITHTSTATGTTTISANIGPNVTGVTQNSATSQLTLSGTNNYAGPTTVTAGTLLVTQQMALYNNNTASWTASNIVVNSGAVLALNVGGAAEFTSNNLGILLGLGTATGGFMNGSFVRLDTTNAVGGNFVHDLAITDTNGGANALGLIKVGTGTLSLTGVNTYSGGTTITAGTLSGSIGGGNLLLNGGVYENSGTFTRALGTGAGQVQWAAGANGGFSAQGGALTVTFAGAPATLVWNSTPNFVSGTGQLLFGSTTSDNVVTFTHNIDLNDPGSAVTRTVQVLDNTTVTTDKTVFSGTISGGANAALAKTGAGVLELTGANTYTGSTLASAGTLLVSSIGGTGVTSSNLGAGNAAISIGSGNTTAGILTYTGAGETTDRAVNLVAGTTGSGTINSSGTGALNWQGNVTSAGTTKTFTLGGTYTGGANTFSGTINIGTGNFSKMGAGTWVLTAANTFVNTTIGSSTVDGGTLRLTGAGTLGAGTLTVTAGDLEIAGSADVTATTLTMGGGTGNQASIDIGSSRTLSATAITYTGTASATGVIKGLGTLNLGNAGITVTVADNAANAVDMSWEMNTLTGSNVFIKAGAGTLDIRSIGTNSFSGSYQVTAGAILGLNALSNNLILNGGVFEGSGTFTRSLGTGDNQVQWLGSGGGGFSAQGGDLTVTLAGAPGALVWGGTTNFVPNAAPLIFGSTSADSVVYFTHNIDLNGAVRTVQVVDNTTTLTDWAVLAGVLSNGGLTKTGNGILRLSGSNTFSGGLIINGTGGAVDFVSADNLGALNNAISLQAGFLRFVGSTNLDLSNPITVNPGTASQTSGLQNLGANGTGGAVITFSGAINTGANNITLTGTGEGRITGGITMTGGAADLIGSSGTWTFSGTPSVLTDDFINTGAAIIINLNSTGVITWGASPSSSPNFYLRGGAVANLGADDAITFLSSSNLVLGDVSGTAAVNTLNMNGHTLTVPNLALGALNDDYVGVITGPGTLTVGTAIALNSGSISANLAGAGVLTKAGVGTVILRGDNSGLTTTTTTTISAGTLLLDYATSNGGKLSAGAALTMTGGTLRLEGNASANTTQTLNGLILSAGSYAIELEQGGTQSLTLNVGAITRSASGVIHFSLSDKSHVLTSATNGFGDVLAGWATINNRFAGVSGGEIVAVAAVAKDNLTTWAAGDNLTDLNGFFNTVGTLSVNSLVFESANASTVTISAGNKLTIASGGILVVEGAGAGGITGGALLAAISNGSLVITQNNTAANFTISSSIVDSTITKAGAGTLVLAGNNDVSDRTFYIGAGTVRALGGHAIGDLTVVTLSNSYGVDTTLDLSNQTERIGGLAGGSVNDTLDTSYGLVQLGATGTLIDDMRAAASLNANLAGGDGSTFVKSGWGALTTNSAASSFTGALIINQGGIRLDGNTTAQDVFSKAKSITLNGAGTISGSNSYLISDQDQSGSVDLIGNTASITLANTAPNTFNGVALAALAHGLIVGNGQNGTRTETVGQVTLQNGQNSIFSYSYLADTNTLSIGVLAMAGLTRQGHATLLVAGTRLGGAAALPTGRITIAGVTSATVNLIGGIGGGSTTVDTPNWSIVPYMIGQTDVINTTSETSFYTATGNSFVTYGASGLRPLDLNTEYEQLVAAGGVTTANNVRYSSASDLTLNGVNKTMNSLLVDNTSATATMTLNGAGGSLNLGGGAFLFTSSGALPQGITLTNFSAITTGTGEYIVFVPSVAANTVVTLDAPLTTSAAALVKAGNGILKLTSTASTYGRGTWINQGLIEISTLSALGTGDVTFDGGGIRWAAGASFDPTNTARVLTFLSGGAVFDTNGNNVSVAHAMGNGGSGGLTKLGEGTLTLTSASAVDFGGSIIVAGGSTATSALVQGVANALRSGTNIELGLSGIAGGYLDIGGFTTTLGGLLVNNASTIAGSADLTFTGNAEVHGGGSRTLTVNNSGLTTFDGDFLVLVDRGTTARTLTINGTGNVTINNRMVDGTAVGTLSKSGAGTLILSGANTYTGTTTNTTGTLVFSGSNSSAGATTLTSGTIQLDSDSNGGLASGTLTLTAGTLQALNAARSISNNVLLTAVTVSGTQNLTINGTLTAATGGSRTLTSSITGGSTLTLGNVAINNDITAARTLTIAGTGPTTVNGVISNGNGDAFANGLTITNTGTTTLSGANTYSGLTTMNAAAGTLVLAGSNSSAGGTTLTTGRINFNSATALASGLFTITAGTIDNTSGASLTLTTNQATTLGGNFTFAGTDNLNLGSGIVSNSGSRTITLGGTGKTLTLGAMTNTLATANTMTVNGAGNTLAVGSYALSNSATSLIDVITGSANVTITGAVTNGGTSSASGLTYTGTGILTLGGANTYAGATTVNSATGTLVLSGSNNSAGTTVLTTGTIQFNSASNGGLASGTLTLSAGTLQALNAARAISNNLILTAVTVSGSQSLTINGTLTATGAADRTLTSSITGGQTLTLNAINISDNATSRTLIIDGTGNTTVNGTIANGTATTGALTIANSATTTLTAANTYTGVTTVSAGTLVISNGAALGGITNGTSVASGATLRLSGGITVSGELLSLVAAASDAILSSSNGSNTWTGALTVNTGTGAGRVRILSEAGSSLLISGNVNLSSGTQDFVIGGDGNGEISGQITGSQRLFKSASGTGTWIISRNNSATFTGRTSIGNGALQISTESNLGATPGAYASDQLTLGSATTNGRLITTGTTSLSANRGVTIAAGGGTFETAATTTLTVSSIITGTGTLTKEGSGTLIFTAVNTNTGATTVNAGILGGTGAVGGDLTVASGGTLAPGVNGAGQFTVAGNLSVSGTLLMELGGATANDALAVRSYFDSHGGSLTGLTVKPEYEVGSSAHDSIVVNGNAAPVINGTLKLGSLIGGYTPAYGDIFDLLDWTAVGPITGTGTTFDFTSVSLSAGLGWNTDLFASNGLIVVVPEPSRVLFLMLGLFGLMIRRRRRTVS